jgi:hypothetical protein
MSEVLAKLIRSLRNRGLAATVGQVRFALLSPKRRFEEIYRSNSWGSNESVSGPGSTLEYTRHLRSALPGLLDQFNVRTLLDVPCGDFLWMQLVLKERPTTYVGGDIVKSLIEHNRRKHANRSTSFVQLDLTKDALPSADMLLCRDCLFHLSFRDTRDALKRFVESKIPYLFTTTHLNDGFSNTDILTGGFRRVDLFSAPYHFPTQALAQIDDWMPGHPKRFMCVWHRDQVIDAVTRFERSLA